MNSSPIDDQRRDIVRAALAISLGTGVYALAFAATATAAGASLLQCVVLSTVMFTGASQLALVSVLADGGSAGSAVAVAVGLGARNLLYAVRMSPLLPRRIGPRLLAAHLTIDETTAMATSQTNPALARLAFWTTGLALWTCWNVGTVAGALGTSLIDDPAALGLDVMFPAAFLTFVAPRLRDRVGRRAAALSVVLTVATTWWAPRGVPLLIAALATVVVGLRAARTPPTAP